jgi:hypothetical protein
MRRRLIIMLILPGLLLSVYPTPIHAQSAIRVKNDQAILKFPEWVAFSVDLQSDVEISRVVLEYGVRQMGCATVVSKAFPQFTPGKSTSAKWTWEMKQTGSEPPGATLWWRWHVTNASGQEQVTELQTITWIDTWRNWQTLKGEQVVLHWYTGSQAYAAELLDSADKSLVSLAKSTGLSADSPIDLYTYANSTDLRDAVLYEPGWIGGMAFPAYDSVIISIPANQMEWGKRAVAHELTHVLVGRYAFTCLGDEPTWLQEGLAVYGEGGPEPEMQNQFKTALTDDKLMSVRALSGNFAEAATKADLSYGESYSLVNLLITEYGQNKMLTLLRTLKDGTKIDDALKTIYGFDSEGFEDAWRAKIGAKPRAQAGNAVATPTPTLVPTFAPVPGVVTPTATPRPATPTLTPTASPLPTETPVPTATRNASVFSPASGLLIGLVILIVVVAAIVILVIKRR